MRPLVPSPGGIPLAFARTPFAHDVHRDELPFGLTVAEVLRTVPDLPDRFWTHGIVCLNCDALGTCEAIPRECWTSVRLTEKPVQVKVTMHMPLAGGGGGGGGGNRKSTFALIASIALLAATTAISAGTLGPITGGILGAGRFATAAAAAGLGIVGSLAITALTPPPSLQRDDGDDSRELGSASASGNVLEPGGVIPRVIGTFRASPSYATFPLVDISGDDEIVEAVYAMSGPHQWASIRVDGVPIASDAAFSSQTRNGLTTDTPLTLVTRQGFTEAPTLELSEHELALDSQIDLRNQAVPANSLPRWHTLVTRRNPDEVWLTLLFPEGFLFADDPDRTVNVPLRFRMRVRGATTWINLPEVHFSWRGGTSFRKAVKFKWQTAPAIPVPDDQFAPIYAYKAVASQDVAPIGLGGWTADSYFSAGALKHLYSAGFATLATTNVRNVGLYSDRVEFYLGPPTDPFSAFGNLAPTGEPVGAVWEIQVMRGQPYGADSFDPATYIFNTLAQRLDLFGYWTTDVHRVWEDGQNGRDKIIITRVATVWNEHPIGGTGLALLAVKARNKTLQNVSALLSGLVPDWNGSAWVGNVATSNPAPHYRYILTGGVNADPLPVELVDEDSLLDWRTRCAADALTCNMIADGRNADELLKVVAGCGFARPRQSEVWGVVQDRDRSAEAPVQIFTPRNMAGFLFEKDFPVLPHGFRLRYPDADRDYEEAPELVVYAEGFSAANAERLEGVTYDGLTTEDAVARRATFDLAQAQLRSTFYYGEVDAEALVSTKGDLVGVQHDILTRAAGFARVKEKRLSVGNVTGLLLDSKIPTRLGADFFSIEDLFTTPDIFALEGTTGIAIRMKDGSGVVIQHELSDPTGYVDEIAFVSQFADPGDELGEGCLIASGVLGSEYLRLLISDIQPGKDLTAALTLVDEAPTLWPHTIFAFGNINMMLALAGAANREAAAAGSIAIVSTLAGGSSTTMEMLGRGLVDIVTTLDGIATGPISASGTIAIMSGMTGAAARSFDGSFDGSFA